MSVGQGDGNRSYIATRQLYERLNWKMFASGYVPEYFYQEGRLEAGAI